MDDQNYAALRIALEEAFDQAAHGKGKDRHANNKAFTQQPIMEITRMVGPGYPIGQAMKKGQEAMTMFSRVDRYKAQAELLGAIVYLAAAWTLMHEMNASND
jgi:hypothetical protein